MAEGQFRLRFRILIGKPLTSKETTLSPTFEGREVLIKSQMILFGASVSGGKNPVPGGRLEECDSDYRGRVMG